jgi:hypothetical protein
MTQQQIRRQPGQPGLAGELKSETIPLGEHY